MVYADIYVVKLAMMGIGIEAKVLASGVFISKRDPLLVMKEDLHKVVNFIDLEIDNVDNTVTATAFGFFERTAVYREGLGCTLLIDAADRRSLPKVTVDLTPKPENQRTLPWPTGERIESDELPPGVDGALLEQALDEAFTEPDYDNPRRTRAVVVLYDGRIVAERYALSINRSTPLPGYGMTQSVINALVGIMVRNDALSLNDPAKVPEWNGQNDPRRTITLDHLLRMSSGLAFDDSTPPLTDTVRMLGKADMAAYAADKPLEAEPGSVWSFSNGTTNIISRLLRHSFNSSDNDYYLHPRRELFDKIGMRNAVIEPDESGTFVGSSYMHAAARDWARFGLLYLWDGVWEGERILPEGWVDYSRTPASDGPGSLYGAHFWLDPLGPSGWDRQKQSILPEDAFFALGHNGQSVTIIPSRKLVVVRLGLTKNAELWDLESFLLNILKAIEE